MNFRDASKQEYVREGKKIGRGDGQSFSEGKTTRHNYKFIFYSRLRRVKFQPTNFESKG